MAFTLWPVLTACQLIVGKLVDGFRSREVSTKIAQFEGKESKKLLMDFILTILSDFL